VGNAIRNTQRLSATAGTWARPTAPPACRFPSLPPEDASRLTRAIEREQRAARHDRLWWGAFAAAVRPDFPRLQPREEVR
jgi:hypothetical protein